MCMPVSDSFIHSSIQSIKMTKGHGEPMKCQIPHFLGDARIEQDRDEGSWCKSGPLCHLLAVGGHWTSQLALQIYSILLHSAPCPRSTHSWAPLPSGFWWTLAYGRHWPEVTWEESQGGGCFFSSLLTGCQGLALHLPAPPPRSEDQSSFPEAPEYTYSLWVPMALTPCSFRPSGVRAPCCH